MNRVPLERVRCQICGWWGKQIGTGHLARHGIKARDYRRQFPSASMTSQSTRSLLQEKARSRPPQSEEKKQRISTSMYRVYHETDFPLREKNENQFGSANSFYGKSHTQATRRSIGEKSTAWLKNAYATGRKISPLTYLGRGNTPSAMEQVVGDFLRPLGFVFDHPVSFRKGFYSIDFALVERKFGIELDSPLHHKTRERDKRKDHFLRSEGWTIVRVPFRNSEDPKEVIQRIQEVLLTIP